MSINSQINRIKTNIENAYNTAQEKGAIIPDMKNSENLVSCIASINNSASQFNIDIENMLGTIENGILSQKEIKAPNFSSIKEINQNVLYCSFIKKQFESTGTDIIFNSLTDVKTYGLNKSFSESNITSISFPELVNVESFSMGSCCEYCYSLKTISFNKLVEIPENSFSSICSNCSILEKVDFPLLENINSKGLQYAFQNCSTLVNVNLQNIKIVDQYGLGNAFQNCYILETIDLPLLESIGDYGMQRCFQNCNKFNSVKFPLLKTLGSQAMYGCFMSTALTSISFPSLTSVQSNSFGSSSLYYAFNNVTTLLEIHFRADMQSTIESMTGYDAKWGATNATIYFDL